MCIQLHCPKSGHIHHVAKAHIVAWSHDFCPSNDKGSKVCLSNGAELCVKESPECIHEMLHACQKDAQPAA